MKRRSFIKKYNNENGVAAVLVLAVILVLTALGTIALVASAANISMGSKSKNWSTEFYSLDSQAEELVQKVDAQLTIAEQDAVEYVQSRYDAMPTTATAFISSKFKTVYQMDDGTDSGAQKFFYNHYKDEWTTAGGIAITVQDYIDDTTTYPNPDDARTAYENDLKEYMSDVFDRVYFYLVSKRLNELAISSPGVIPDVALVLKGGAGKYGYPDPNTAQWCTNKFISLNALSVWDSSTKPADGDIGVYVLAQDPAVAGKRVETEISVIVPRYETVIQRINIPYKGNPIWANALSVEGKITVEQYKSLIVEGDVYASGDGVEATTGSTIQIRGNVYTAGDLHATGNNGKIRVYTKHTAAASHTYGLKQLIYNSELFFDKSLVDYMAPDSIDSYTEGGALPGGMMPFIYNDMNNWGNVYCNNVAVEEGVENAEVTVDGNVWTKDDVQIDGANSTITIGSTAGTRTNYIGLKSESTGYDPNASSSIINNQPFEEDGITRSSTIVLNSNLIVPGVAFYEFTDGPSASRVTTATGETRYYYKSAESVSARTTSPTAIFSAYLTTGAAFELYEREDAEYQLITPEGIKLNTLINFIGSVPGGVKTDIIKGLTGTPEGYSLGAALIQNNEGTSATLYAGIGGTSLGNHSANLAGYYTLNNIGREPSSASPLKQGVLMDIFVSKTSWLGTATQETNFNEYVNSSFPGSNSEILYLPGNSIHTISGSSSGIIYCDGDLTLTGDGTFSGTVICAGNLRISGNITVVYNENIIDYKLKNSKNVRDFFEKGSTGADIGFVQEYATTSGNRTIVKRYKVLNWREVQE